MSRNELPFEALTRNPLPTFADAQQQQLQIENARRAGQLQKTQMDQQQRQQQDAATIRKILSAGLPDKDTIAQLKRFVPEAGIEYEKHIMDRDRSYMEMDDSLRKRAQAEAQQTAQTYRALLEAPPERRPELAVQVGIEGPLDEEHLKFRVHKAMSDAEATARINAELAQEQAGRPQAFGSAFVGEGGQQTQPYFQYNPATGQHDIKTRTFGPVEAKPGAGSFEAQTYDDFIKDPALTQKYGASRVGFQKWQSDLIESRQRAPDPNISAMRVETRIDNIRSQYNAHPVVKKYNIVQDAVQFVKGLDLNTRNPADDQALIYAFAKAMDPDSVVREGEYATVQKYSQSWAQQFGFDAQRIFSNTPFLTPQARSNMKKTIESRSKPVSQQYRAVYNDYKKRADQIVPGSGKDYIPDYAEAFAEAAPVDTAPVDTFYPPAGRPGAAAAGPKVGTVDSGYVFQGGDPANPKNWKKQ